MTGRRLWRCWKRQSGVTSAMTSELPGRCDQNRPCDPAVHRPRPETHPRGTEVALIDRNPWCVSGCATPCYGSAEQSSSARCGRNFAGANIGAGHRPLAASSLAPPLSPRPGPLFSPVKDTPHEHFRCPCPPVTAIVPYRRPPAPGGVMTGSGPGRGPIRCRKGRICGDRVRCRRRSGEHRLNCWFWRSRAWWPGV